MIACALVLEPTSAEAPTFSAEGSSAHLHYVVLAIVVKFHIKFKVVQRRMLSHSWSESCQELLQIIAQIFFLLRLESQLSNKFKSCKSRRTSCLYHMVLGFYPHEPSLLDLKPFLSEVTLALHLDVRRLRIGNSEIKSKPQNPRNYLP